METKQINNTFFKYHSKNKLDWHLSDLLADAFERVYSPFQVITFKYMSMLLYLIAKVPLHCLHSFLCHESYVQINVFCLNSHEAFRNVALPQSVSFSVFSFLLSKSPPLSFLSNSTHDSSVNRVHTTLLVYYRAL